MLGASMTATRPRAHPPRRGLKRGHQGNSISSPHKHIRIRAPSPSNSNSPTNSNSPQFITNASIQDEIDVQLATQHRLSQDLLSTPTNHIQVKPQTFAQATMGRKTRAYETEEDEDVWPMPDRGARTLESVATIKHVLKRKKGKNGGGTLKWTEEAGTTFGAPSEFDTDFDTETHPDFETTSHHPSFSATSTIEQESKTAQEGVDLTAEHEKYGFTSVEEDTQTVYATEDESTIATATDTTKIEHHHEAAAFPITLTTSAEHLFTPKADKGGDDKNKRGGENIKDLPTNLQSAPNFFLSNSGNIFSRELTIDRSFGFGRTQSTFFPDTTTRRENLPVRGDSFYPSGRTLGQQFQIRSFSDASSKPALSLSVQTSSAGNALPRPALLTNPSSFRSQTSTTSAGSTHSDVFDPDDCFLVSAETVNKTIADSALLPHLPNHTFTLPELVQPPQLTIGTLDPIEDDHSDTQSVIDRTEAVLAKLSRGNSTIDMAPFSAPKLTNDAFDSLEWDPELPSAPSPDKSPEPVALKPQPVAYTTVGSLVDLSAVPQFNAPNRIQREGANRRPLMSLLQGGQFDSLFQARGPPPPLRDASNMQYAQQLTRSASGGTFKRSATISSGASTVSNTRNISGAHNWLKENEPFPNFRGARPPQPVTEFPKDFLDDLVATPDNQFPVEDGMDSEFLTEHVSVHEAFDELAAGRGDAVYGLEKMQTIRSLAKYPNPMQGRALRLLSEFALGKSQTASKSLGSAGGASPLDMLTRKSSALESLTGRGRGELDQNFRFPPPGLSGLVHNSSNPLYGLPQGLSSQSSAAITRPGYPRPLTAGPPGLRQWPANNTGFASSSNMQYENEYQQSAAPYDALQQPDSYQQLGTESYNRGRVLIVSPDCPWAAQMEWPSPDGTGTVLISDAVTQMTKTKIVDTEPVERIAQYYRYGYPSDMHKEFHANLAKQLVSSGLSTNTFQMEAAAREEELAARNKANQEWFYSGLREFHKAYDQKKIDREERNAFAKTNPLGPIGPPKKPLEQLVLKPITRDQMEKMSVAEAAAPLFLNVLATLEDYQDKENPNSRYNLSKFQTPPTWQVDSSEAGNATMFGEDWGPPPKRIGRDPRYASGRGGRGMSVWED